MDARSALSDIAFLYRRLVELYGERRIFLVDEIQNIPDWERFVRRFMDLGLKFYITSSNAALLSRELGTLLTGRYLLVVQWGRCLCQSVSGSS